MSFNWQVDEKTEQWYAHPRTVTQYRNKQITDSRRAMNGSQTHDAEQIKPYTV